MAGRFGAPSGRGRADGARAARVKLEAFPEADRLDDFPHPRETPALYGQEAAQPTFAEALASGRMHHAWLLAGPAGDRQGDARLSVRPRGAGATRGARSFGHGLAIDPTREPTGKSARCPIRRCSSSGAPTTKRQSVSRRRFRLTRSVGSRTFCHSARTGRGGASSSSTRADELKQNAANALLKSLEEPPARTIFLMMTSSPGRLLPTIRSRCRTIAMGPLPDSDLKRAAGAGSDIGGESRSGGARMGNARAARGGKRRQGARAARRRGPCPSIPDRSGARGPSAARPQNGARAFG